MPKNSLTFAKKLVDFGEFFSLPVETKQQFTAPGRIDQPHPAHQGGGGDPGGEQLRGAVGDLAAVLSWTFAEWMIKGKPSMLGAASGAVAGLVAITPAAGNVGLMGAIVIGFIAGFACLWGVHSLKKLLGADDSLDVFGVHGVCGILGALLTGVFNSPNLGGPSLVADWTTVSMVAADAYSIAGQVWIQLKGVLITIVWSGVVSVIAYKIVDMTIGLRVTEEQEREGLDISSHGETAYNR